MLMTDFFLYELPVTVVHLCMLKAKTEIVACLMEPKN